LSLIVRQVQSQDRVRVLDRRHRVSGLEVAHAT
jgi:hypothetical protein